MKLAFITCDKKGSAQGDYLEVCILNGLRKVLGNNCIDFPRKKIMYGDWSEVKKTDLHGRGFSLYNNPISDISECDRSLDGIDAILYGSNHANLKRYPEIDSLVKPENIFFLDGNDLYGDAPIKFHFNGEIIIGNQFKNCFKREFIHQEDKVWPTGFGIPYERIMPIDLPSKSQLIQSTAPYHSVFQPPSDMWGSSKHYKFFDENDYYDDLRKSWFGLTSIKGGWDCMRHYEILAAGTLLLFRDYHKKPELCSPVNLPCLSYSTESELESIINRLLKNGKPTKEYTSLLLNQREWLLANATTEARALSILKIIDKEKNVIA